MGKRLEQARKIYDSTKRYSLEEALDILVKYDESHSAKFNETLEVIIKLGINTKRNEVIRGMVEMPSGLSKEVRVAVFVRPERIKDAEASGADVFGSEELVEEVKNGKINFDLCIATPDMMVAMAKLGKVLGPRGLMPNPKLGTVTDDIKEAVKRAKAGQVEYKTEKGGIIHAGVGKIKSSKEALKKNIMALYDSVLGSKPEGFKGEYLKDLFISSTQGISIKLDLNKLAS